jgi:hypothetical protein
MVRDHSWVSDVWDIFRTALCCEVTCTCKYVWLPVTKITVGELHILVKNRRYQSHMFGISWRKKWGKEEFHRIVFLFGVWKISLPEAYSFHQTTYRARLREKKL